MSRKEELHRVGPYIIGNTLGAGITGKVKLAFDKDTGEQVAIKIISKELIKKKPSMAPKLEREIAIMKLMDHPNVLHMYDECETEDSIYLVLEYAQNGELFEFLVRKGALDASLALKIFQQIIEGVDYGHKHFVCHRDLKPENILLDAENNIKIADFGMSGIRSVESLFETSCGSPHYASPEVVQGITYDGEKADIWSCGVILFALISGKLPFDNENIRILLNKVKAGVFTMPAFIPKEIQDLISKMLVVDPQQRISMDEIRAHPWYRSVPVKTEPTPVLEKSDAVVLEEDIDNDIVRSLKAFGYGTEQQIKDLLCSAEPNHVKTLYQLYTARKNEPRAIEKSWKRLSRAKSESMMSKNGMAHPAKAESGTSGIKPSANTILTKKKKLIRRRSYNVNHGVSLNEGQTDAPVKVLKRTPSKVLRIKLEPQKEKESPRDIVTARKSWLPTWFGNPTDSNLRKEKKKNLKDGIASHKTISELTLELEETLEALGATYSFTNKRDRIKARMSKDSKSVKFAITILKVTDDEPKKEEPISSTYWITFTRRAGDKVLYNEICENIKQILDV